jgi:hypothetical protein
MTKGGTVMEDEFIVNVGNIGNITCETVEEAIETYKEYVVQSKDGYGRASQESVCILVYGEPDQAYDFNWYDWRIQKQREVITKLQNEKVKAIKTLNNLIEQQQEVQG